MGRANMSFEDQWNEAFDGAEVTPPEHVWASIDGVLANKEASGYKKRIIFFKWMAAASVALAVVFGVALLNQEVGEEHVVAESVESVASPNMDETTSAEPVGSDAVQSFEDAIADSEKKPNSVNEKKPAGGSGESSALAVIYDDSEEGDLESTEEDEVVESGQESTTAFIGESNEAGKNDVVEIKEINSIGQIAFLDNKEISYLKPKVLENESYVKPWEADVLYLVPDLSAGQGVAAYQGFDLWAGLSLGSGSFNPGTEGNDFESAMLDSGDPLFGAYSGASANSGSDSYVSGSSFSAGMDVGGKLSKKILLSSGLHYSAVSPGSSSSIIVTDNQSNKSFALARNTVGTENLDAELQSGNLTVSQGTTNFSNTLQYLTIPLKAGYVVLDRKLNLTVNSGMATNILIGSSLNNSEGGLQNFGGTSSANDTFSKTYFDLLTSVELGYRLMDKYYLSLEPNYRRAINNFTKKGNSLEGKPTNFGVSLGVKYNF